jgi:micrococcal nuclease
LILARALALTLALAACGARMDLPLVATDGDSFRAGAERVRLMDIDAPEMPGSPRDCSRRRCPIGDPYLARDALQTLLNQGKVSCVRHGEDRYSRTLARCRAGRQDIGETLLEMRVVERYEP